MKRLRYLIFGIICMVGSITFVNAAKPTFSFDVNRGTVEDGNKVTATVTVRNAGAWDVKITSAGNTNGCSNHWADTTSDGKDATKSFSVTCTSKGVGRITFTVTGDVTGSGGTTTLSGTKSVNVIERVPDSVINTLKDIKVDEYDLNPTFDPETLEYTVSVPPTTTKVNIDATRTDTKSRVSGTGEHEVVDGPNRFELVVTAQSGAVRTYVVNVNVEDKDPIMVDVKGEKYSILKTSRSISIPSLYTEDKITINGNEVPCFVNEANGLTLVALKNTLGNISFFIYENNLFTPYIELVSSALMVYPLDKDLDYKNFTKTTCKFGDEEISCYKHKTINNEYSLVYGMNLEDGTKNVYLYDEVNGNFQVFNEELYNSLIEDTYFFIYIILGSAFIIVICLIVIISLIVDKKKINKTIKKIEEKLKNNSHSSSKNDLLIKNIAKSNEKDREAVEEKRKAKPKVKEEVKPTEKQEDKQEEVKEEKPKKEEPKVEEEKKEAPVELKDGKNKKFEKLENGKHTKK